VLADASGNALECHRLHGAPEHQPGHAGRVGTAGTAADTDVLRILVQVDYDGQSLVLEGYRTRYAPNRPMKMTPSARPRLHPGRDDRSMVVLGILSAIVAVFIRAPILGYRDSVDRAEITDQADLALRRMARDIRLALPNSVRVNADGSLLEFLQTRSGARYLAAEDGVDGAVPDFDDASKVDFTAVAPPASFARVRRATTWWSSTSGEGFEPANAYAVPAPALPVTSPGSNRAWTARSSLPGDDSATPSVTLTLAAIPSRARRCRWPRPTSASRWCPARSASTARPAPTAL
jgi:hypothetical protein